MQGASIKYGDVAPGAKENFAPTASETEFNTLGQLQMYNLDFPNYANPCELYQTALDGKAVPFPTVSDQTNVGLWSERISNDKGLFVDDEANEKPIVLTLTANGQYSSQGLTLTFDTYNSIYCNHLNIKWYRNGQLIVDDGKSMNIDFYPDNAFYFCRNQVNNYDKVVITFYSLNMPKNRLKLHSVDYGYGTYFYGRELRNVKLLQSIDPISTEININTVDFTLDSKTDMEYSFQAKQPLSVYFNDRLLATTFVKSSQRKSRFLWEIQGEDYVGLLDGITFYGGMYKDKNAVELLEEIFTIAKIPYTIEALFQDVAVSGYIPICSCRVAVMNVAFAIGAVVDTSNSETVDVYVLSDEVKQTIQLNRIMQGQSFEEEDTVTGVEVAMHSYKLITETVDVYDSNESGTGQNILVKFSEPLHDLSITNGTFALDENGEELKHTNYAVINANENCILRGQKYEHITQTRRENNPLVLENEIENVVSIEDATLVSMSNIEAVLDRCFRWFVLTRKINCSILEGKNTVNGVVTYDESVNVGETIETETEYLGNLSGKIIEQACTLNGSIIIKDVVMR